MANPVLLIVDDEHDILATLAMRFIAKGYEVLLAQDGDEALELFTLRKPDVVVMDVRLPTLDGFAVMREMLTARPGALIIMTSAFVTADQARMVLNEGARDFIPKPIYMDLLLTSVESLVLTQQ